MSEPTDRFVIETGTGTVAHIIDTDSDESETDPMVSLGFSGSGKKICSRGYRDFRSQQLPFSVFVDEHSQPGREASRRVAPLRIGFNIRCFPPVRGR